MERDTQTRIQHYLKKDKTVATGYKGKNDTSRFLICENEGDPEGWLLDLIHYRMPSGSISSNITIIRKDLKMYLHLLQREAYIIHVNSFRRQKKLNPMKRLK